MSDQHRVTEQTCAPQLQEKDRLAAVGITATMFAHEVSNPLNGMSTTIQLLEQFLRKKEFTDKDEALARLDDLKGEIRRLHDLLEEFRNLARPSAVFEPVDLGKIISDVIKVSASNETRQGIRFVEDLASDLPPVNGDADKLKQALLNLIKNSAEATRGGGTITIKLYRRGADVCLEVADTGEGIPENVKIFDLFETTKPGGTGLGLVIVQQIVSAHGGSISYTSQPNRGTTFRLTLPSATASGSE